MGILEKTRFGDWTEFGYSSFYKRYVLSLETIAKRRFGSSAEEAASLAHEFIADQCCAESGGILATFDKSRQFRPYLVTAFLNHCARKRKKGSDVSQIDHDPVAPDSADPEWNLLAEEADRLRATVRKAINLAREDLLQQGRLPPDERIYLELKWPTETSGLPLPDRKIGEELVARGVLEPRSASSLTRAACRIGERVGMKLLYNLRQLLRTEYARHMPEAQVEPETAMSLKAIVHVLGLEEQEV